MSWVLWAAGGYLALCLWFAWEIHVAPVVEPDEDDYQFHPGDRL